MKYGFAMEMRGGAAAIRGREGKHIVSNAECLEAGLGRMERAKELIYRCRVQSPCSKPVASLVRSEALLFDGGINHEASIMVRRTSSVSSRGPRRCPRRPQTQLETRHCQNVKPGTRNPCTGFSVFLFRPYCPLTVP